MRVGSNYIKYKITITFHYDFVLEPSPDANCRFLQNSYILKSVLIAFHYMHFEIIGLTL